MRRIKVILAAAAAMAVLMVVTAAPAMAQDFEVGGVDFVSGECVVIDEFGLLTDNCFDNGDDTELVIGDGSSDFSIEGGSGSIQSVNQVDSTSGDVEFNNGGSSSGGSGTVGNQQGVTQSGGGRGGDIKGGGGGFSIG